ncbi:hypothetical protein BC629DRAFT_1442188 [Irpex lacteus]|nr:hypothetical protein BC629DRAFT_1442188 [Irpex lacteus]
MPQLANSHYTTEWIEVAESETIASPGHNIFAPVVRKYIPKVGNKIHPAADKLETYQNVAALAMTYNTYCMALHGRIRGFSGKDTGGRRGRSYTWEHQAVQRGGARNLRSERPIERSAWRPSRTWWHLELELYRSSTARRLLGPYIGLGRLGFMRCPREWLCDKSTVNAVESTRLFNMLQLTYGSNETYDANHGDFEEL